MATSELVFIPSPGAGHLPSTMQLAKLLLDRDDRLSISIILMHLPLGAMPSDESTNSTPRLRLIQIPSDESTNSNVFFLALIEHQKPQVRNIVRGITESESVHVVGFVVDMFCATMTEVANEFGVPTYVYYPGNMASLGLMLHLQAKHDEKEGAFDVTKLKGSEMKLSVPTYANPVPVKVLPSLLFHNDGASNTFDGLARKYRGTKGIIVNTFHELETHAMDWFLKSDIDPNANVPPIYPVGPILNKPMKNTSNNNNNNDNDDIIKWLNEQPERSVVFLCFGSLGCFNEEQVKEIGVALERSGIRFLWSLRRPPTTDETKMAAPNVEYDNLDEVLPEGFLERTSSVGKVIGLAPQMAVLSHPSVGGFVSHCGWNSILESIWCGVPMAAWPIYAEQHLNAFKLVVELGIATEIRIDNHSKMIVSAEEIETGIRRLMSDDEIRNKVKLLQEKSKFAVSQDGASHVSIARFIDQILPNQ